MNQRIAVYPGSFDPLTLGHDDIIDRSLRLVDRLIVAVAETATQTKSGLFSVRERVEIVQEVYEGRPEIEVTAFRGLLVEFARSHGARLIVDLAWFLVLFLVPVLDATLRRKWLVGLFAVLVGFSVGIQGLGAFAYNLRGWNAKVAGYVVQAPEHGEPEVVPDREAAERMASSTGGRIVNVLRKDVNDPKYRQRLWSWSDNQILHYLVHFGEARRTKREMIRRWLDNPAI